MTKDNAYINVNTSTTVVTQKKPCLECKAIKNIYFFGRQSKKPEWSCENCPFE